MALERTVRWTPWTGTGLEHNRIEIADTGFVAVHGVVAGAAGAPFGLTYYLNLSPDWSFISLALFPIDAVSSSILLHHRSGSWRDANRGASDQHIPELSPCLDIDLAFTPLTNSLPIRRLKLGAGEAKEMMVAHLSAPDFRPKAVEQRYTCIEPMRRYLFESLDSGFQAELEVDEDGLVVDYPGLFRRVRD